MQMTSIPFGVTDWATVPTSEHPGVTGMALWRTCQFCDLRVRMVEYTPGYLADNWCKKGHILLVLEGELEHADRCLTNGDWIHLEDGSCHAPYAFGRGCWCLVRDEGTVQYEGLLGRFLSMRTGA